MKHCSTGIKKKQIMFDFVYELCFLVRHKLEIHNFQFQFTTLLKSHNDIDKYEE